MHEGFHGTTDSNTAVRLVDRLLHCLLHSVTIECQSEFLSNGVYKNSPRSSSCSWPAKSFSACCTARWKESAPRRPWSDAAAARALSPARSRRGATPARLANG